MCETANVITDRNTDGVQRRRAGVVCFKLLLCRYRQEEMALPVFPLSIAHPSDVLDMPVDPNEPTYCLCHQVSYGEMIGCDNPDVS